MVDADKIYRPACFGSAGQARFNPGTFALSWKLIVPLILLDRFTLSMFMPVGSESLEIARHLNIAVWSFLFLAWCSWCPAWSAPPAR